MEEVQIVMERHEQRLNTVERDIRDLREVQNEIKFMNETLATLTAELKHTNEHLSRNEKKLEEIDSQPRVRLQQIVTAVIAALSGGIVTVIISNIFS